MTIAAVVLPLQAMSSGGDSDGRGACVPVSVCAWVQEHMGAQH